MSIERLNSELLTKIVNENINFLNVILTLCSDTVRKFYKNKF